MDKSIAKSLLNNLLCRFGISIDKPFVSIVYFFEFQKICDLYKVESFNQIDREFYLVSYIKSLNIERVVNSYDLSKLMLEFKDNESGYHRNTSVAISAAVNA